MKNCLICKSKNIKSFKTKVSEFIAQRMFCAEETTTELLHCQDCGFAHYSLRPSEEEIKRFYDGYRNNEYQKQRQKYDCWYTEELNEIIGKNPKEVQNRKKYMSNFLTPQIDFSKISNVLDFGGDKGQNVPDEFKGAEKFVYDLSGTEVLEGVTLISDFNELGKYDFIMCQCVLEHVNDPFEITEQFKKVSNQGSYLYIEVPFDSPFYKSPLFNLQFIFSKYYSFKNIVKHFIKNLKNKAFAPMTEHINYFTLNSAEILLKQAGYEVLKSELATVDCGWCKQKMICTLARLR